jgi:phage gp36-like protein
MAYALPTDLINRYDEQTLKDLVSDTGTPEVDLTANPKILAALDDASGMIDAAVTVGEMYQVTELEALTGTAKAFLSRLTCDLAMQFLQSRRASPEMLEWLAQQRKMTDDVLNQIRNGGRVFGLAANRDAGLPKADGPTAVAHSNLNLITTRTKNYYPSVAQRFPVGRQGG